MSIQKLGQGSFGIVYRPYPVDCKETETLPLPKQTYIGKMTDPQRMPPSRVKQRQHYRSMIDPKNQFTSPLYAMCQKKSSSNPSSPYWEPNHTLEYIYPYVGVSWDHLSVPTIRYHPLCIQYLFKSFHRLLKGLDYMIQHEMVHGDIKLANLTYDLYKNKTYLIDYDYLMNKHELLSTFKNDLHKRTYMVWPPEINFGLLQNEIKNRSTLESCLWKNRLFPMSTEEIYQKWSSFLKSDTFIHKIYKKDSLEFWTKLDIYSLGLTWAILFGKTNPDIWKLTLRMIELDYFRRIDIKTLLVEYNRILKSFSWIHRPLRDTTLILVLCVNDNSYETKPIDFRNPLFGKHPRFMYVGLDLQPDPSKKKFKRNIKIQPLDFLKDNSLDLIVSEACPVYGFSSMLSTFSIRQFYKKLKRNGRLLLQKPLYSNQYTIDGVDTDTKPFLNEFRWEKEITLFKSNRSMVYYVYKPRQHAFV